MTVFENENGTLSDMSLENENGTLSDMGEEIFDDACCAVDAVIPDPADEQIGNIADDKCGRDEYERLIKTIYKDFFAEDTQRIISKRFKKYKALEERVRELEGEAARYADIERLISDERERAVSETEERMNRQFIAMRSRVQENAVGKRSHRCSPDVSSLTKSERAHLASRALMGEKIKL